MTNAVASTPQRQSYDLIVVGGGIVGLATARELSLRHPGWSLAVLEKEPGIAAHQTGHNSGVIHAGIYYKPGSLKAKACVAGHRAMIEFCEQNGLPYERCGKVIVALTQDELPRLQDLYECGMTNGVQGLELIGPERLCEIEPFATGIRAIYSPNTGIVDYVKVAHAYADEVRQRGGEIVTNSRVVSLTSQGERTQVSIRPNTERLNGLEGVLEAKRAVTCAGLHSDKISQDESRAPSQIQIVPFRGDYYVLRPEKRHMTRGMIYPVPDPRFPFLGVHYTRRLNGEVRVGPNAVLAFAREGYRRRDLNLRDLWESLRYPGFWRLAAKYWRMGLVEMYRDYVKVAYVKDAQRYVPELTADDLLPGPSGVRAQALGRDGSLVDDFLIKRQGGVIHVQNAPSPAATSSLIIARMVADEVERSLTP